jgi:hypothetical protein
MEREEGGGADFCRRVLLERNQGYSDHSLDLRIGVMC